MNTYMDTKIDKSIQQIQHQGQAQNEPPNINSFGWKLEYPPKKMAWAVWHLSSEWPNKQHNGS